MRSLPFCQTCLERHLHQLYLGAVEKKALAVHDLCEGTWQHKKRPMTHRVPFPVLYCLFTSCSKVLCKAALFIINPFPNSYCGAEESYLGHSEVALFVLCKPRSNSDLQKYDAGTPVLDGHFSFQQHERVALSMPKQSRQKQWTLLHRYQYCQPGEFRNNEVALSGMRL